MSNCSYSKKKNGFTLIETLVSVSLFLIIAVSFADIYKRILNLSEITRYKNIATFVLNNEIEIIRNLPYAEVGVENSIPDGVLPDEKLVNYNGLNFTIVPTVRNIDDPFDGTIGGTPNDLSPADSKFVQLDITCSNCPGFDGMSIYTRVSPKNLETASTNGALKIQVLDSNGQPIPEADVTIRNDTPEPDIVITDQTDINGILLVVDVPPAVNGYEIIVTKPGYSTDRTYLPGGAVTNPVSPDLTVSLQQLTQASFSIDQLASLTVRTVAENCSLIGNVPFNIRGNKLIGDSPDVFKYNQNLNSGSGSITINNLEWDTYNVNVTSSLYDLVGLSTLNPLDIDPGASQNIDLVLKNKDSQKLVVTVIDSGSLLPITGAEVDLYSFFGALLGSQVTGKGSLRQTDWTNGPGQADFENIAGFYSSSGISFTSNPGEIILDTFLGDYVASGELESSTFDLGEINNLGEIFWTPQDQPVSTGPSSVRMQIASSNNPNETNWQFLGPDGTSSSFYTISGEPISSVHDGDQYLRYKIYLSTSDNQSTPNVSDIYFTYTGDCTPPGQINFSGLVDGVYDVRVNAPGYVEANQAILITEDWQEIIISMTS